MAEGRILCVSFLCISIESVLWVREKKRQLHFSKIFRFRCRHVLQRFRRLYNRQWRFRSGRGRLCRIYAETPTSHVQGNLWFEKSQLRLMR